MSSDFTPDGARRIYRIMCNVASCDGSVDPAERTVLEQALARFGIESAEASSLEAEGLAGEALEIGEDKSERDLLITCMIDVAAADGRIDAAERKGLVRVAKKIGLSFQELQDQLIPRIS